MGEREELPAEPDDDDVKPSMPPWPTPVPNPPRKALPDGWHRGPSQGPGNSD